MRIYLSTTWALLASIFSGVVAQDPSNASPKFDFDGTTFRGEMFQTQSSVFLYKNISNGLTFRWNQTGDPVDIVRVDLMNGNDESIFFWCSDRSCNETKGFDVRVEQSEITLSSGVVTLSSGVVETLQQLFLEAVLFFRLDWQSRNGKRDGQTFSTYSQEWAVVNDEDGASRVFNAYQTQMTAGGPAARASGSAPTAFTSAITVTTSPVTTASTTSDSTMPTELATENTGSKSKRLSTGAIVGIVVGCVGGVILVSVVAGCFCFRRRRDAGEELGGSRGVQDMIAEKEARASILDKDQPDTPYSEQNSQHPLHRGLGLAGRSESGVDLGIGQAISGDTNGSVRTESLHTVTAGNRNSAVYSSLGGAANSAHGTPVIGSGAFASGHSSPLTQTHTPSMSLHDRSSAMGSPVPRASSQLDRSLSPYRDNAGQHEYSQHHHVVDGADLVQQEHSNASTARSPSSLYSNPLDELQPISPDSAHENDGAAGAGGAGAGGGASSQPSKHSRTNTPSGIAQQYAHLVEEGMTNDEIRRLEEEERALDEAIEQAGTAGRKR